jgi:uncharacterized protein
MGTLRVRVIPRAGRSQLAGMRGDALVVRLAAAPVEGAANAALLELLSDVFDAPRARFTIASGHTSRDKRIDVHGMDDTEIAARISAILRST